MNKHIIILAFLTGLVYPLSALEQDEKVTVEFFVDPGPKVGVPSEISILVRDASTGALMEDINVGVDILIAEDGVKVFSGIFYSPDGRLKIVYNFQDASEHAINLRISPSDASNQRFDPVLKTFLVEVGLPDPPTKVWFKTWLFLMATLLFGVGVSFYVVKMRSRKQEKSSEL